jgi:hypothetical protein
MRRFAGSRRISDRRLVTVMVKRARREFAILSCVSPVSESLFRLSEAVRYVAVYRHGVLTMAERPNVRVPSSGESDRYEELLVNPAVLTLTEQRGDIDCGGLEFVVIRYGRFFQLVHRVPGGHVSISIEPEADPLALVPQVRRVLAAAGLFPA